MAPGEAEESAASQDESSGIAVRVGVSVLVFAAVTCYLALSPLHPATRGIEIAVQFFYLIPYATAMVLSIVAARRTEGTERRLWALLAVSTGTLLASETAWAITAISSGQTPSWLAINIVLTIAAAILFVPLLLSLAQVSGTPLTTRVRYVVDFLIVGVFAYLALTFWIVGPAFSAIGLTLGDAARASAYSVFGGLIIVGVLTNAPYLSRERARVWERLLAVGIALYGLATLISPLWHAAAAGAANDAWLTIVEGMWTAAYAFVAIAVAHRLDAPSQFSFARVYRRPGPKMAFAPVVLILIALLSLPLMMAGAFALFLAGQGQAALIVAGSSVLVAILYTVRFGALGIEFGYLTTRALSDPLTGLANHRILHDHLHAEVDRAVHLGGRVSLVALDVDGFRRVNAAFGHDGGDRLLREIGRRVAAVAGDEALVARPLADQFVVVLPGETSSSARMKAEAMRGEILAASAGEGMPLTTSIGVATFPDHALDADELMHRAQGAQFWAKCEGRDQIVVFDPRVVVALDADERLRYQETESHLRTARALAAAVDARDRDTQYHSVNVSRLAGRLSATLGLEPDHISSVEMAASLHDIGKIGVADSVLLKRGPLSPAERKHIEQHPELAERILASTTMTQVLPWIRSHHERWDGSGYPDGLRDHNIPLEARILAVCDAYDAMVSERPYHARRTPEAALQEIDVNLGTQFDPLVGEAFIRMISEHHAGQRTDVSLATLSGYPNVATSAEMSRGLSARVQPGTDAADTPSS